MHLFEVVQALKFHANMPTHFWGDCLLTATYLINHMPTPILNWKCPSEVLLGVPPDYISLRVFGSLCSAYNMDRSKDKF